MHIICIRAVYCASKCGNTFVLGKHCEVVFRISCAELPLVTHPCSPISGKTHMGYLSSSKPVWDI